MAQHPPSGQLQRFNSVGGVAGFTAVRWASKEGHHPVPVGVPGFAEGGVLLIPTLRNGNEGWLCLSLGRSRVDRRCVRRNLCPQKGFRFCQHVIQMHTLTVAARVVSSIVPC